jgi:hypothetical protein
VSALSVCPLFFSSPSAIGGFQRNLPTHAGVPHEPVPDDRLGRSACRPFRPPGGPPPMISLPISISAAQGESGYVGADYNCFWWHENAAPLEANNAPEYWRKGTSQILLDS